MRGTSTSTRRRRRAPLTAVLVLLAALLIAACGGDDKGAGAGGVTTIKVGTLPISNLAPVYLGMQKGFFREEKLKVEPKVVQDGATLITGALSGDYDFITAGYIPSIVARSKKLPIEIVAANDAGADTAAKEWQVVMVPKGSKIREAKDLAGKTVAVNALKGVAEVDTKASLEKQGLDPNAIKPLEVPFPEMPAALAAKRIDAAFVPEPFVTQVLQAGGRQVDAPLPNLGKHFPNGGYETTEKEIAEKKDLVDRFVRAINKSVDYAASHPDEVRKIIPTYTKIPPQVAQKIRLPVFTSTLEPDKLQQAAEFAKKYAGLPSAPKIEDMIYKTSP